MYRQMKLICLLLVALLVGPVVAHAHPGGRTTLLDDAVRNYDEDVVQANTVNQENGIDLATFKADIATAWDNDTGGVIDFENATLTFDSADNLRHIDVITATYGASGSGKTITLLNGDDSAWDTLGNDGDRGSKPVSGVRILRKSDPGDVPGTLTNDYVFDIGPISDGSVVTSMGITALGRDGNTFLLHAEAIFNDGSTLSIPTTAPFVDQIKEDPGFLGTDDTFFGVTAPPGLWITQFAIANGNLGEFSGGFGHIDDIGFITSQIPEPSSLVLLLGSLVAVSVRTRRLR